MSNHISDFNGKASGDDLDDKTFEDWGALTVEQLTVEIPLNSAN